jgi:hypothetical protein
MAPEGAPNEYPYFGAPIVRIINTRSACHYAGNGNYGTLPNDRWAYLPPKSGNKEMCVYYPCRMKCVEPNTGLVSDFPS